MRATPEKATPEALAALRSAIARLASDPAASADSFSFGHAGLDAVLGGGLARAALHEVFSAGSADAATAAGFGLALAIRAAADRPILWIRQDFVDSEAGHLYAPGLVAFGLDPARLVLVRVRDAAGALKAAGEAARCPALGAVLFETFGTAQVLDLTASRRLSLAAAASGLPVIAIRLAAEPLPSAATSRWQVAATGSAHLAANAPGQPTFAATLVRHRAGIADRSWLLEWSHDRHAFVEPAPLSGAVVAFPVDRPAASANRRAGLCKAG